MTPFEKASEAKRLLENQLLKIALDDIRSGLVSKLENAPISDVETQHEIALMLQLVRRLKDQLWSYLNEQAMIDAKEKHDSFIQRMRKRAA